MSPVFALSLRSIANRRLSVALTVVAAARRANRSCSMVRSVALLIL